MIKLNLYYIYDKKKNSYYKYFFSIYRIKNNIYKTLNK
jgi:hypothetical protein